MHPGRHLEAVAPAVKPHGGLARISREADLSALTVKAYLAASQVHRQTVDKLQRWASAQHHACDGGGARVWSIEDLLMLMARAQEAA
jgi:hypothetical protein